MVNIPVVFCLASPANPTGVRVRYSTKFIVPSIELLKYSEALGGGMETEEDAEARTLSELLTIDHSRVLRAVQTLVRVVSSRMIRILDQLAMAYSLADIHGEAHHVTLGST